MIGTVFAPEPIPPIEALRAIIQRHQGSHCEILVYRCYLFYGEALIELHARTAEKANVLRACMEALLSASACLMEYQTVLSDLDRSRALGNLSAYAFVQALTQIVETMVAIGDALALKFKDVFGTKNGNKDREYWKFRVRHSHVVTWRSAQTPDDPEDADVHIFRLGRTSADHIQYTTLTAQGFIGRSISTDRMAWELQTDLETFFAAALMVLRSLPEKA